MKAIYTMEDRTASQNINSFITKLLVLIILGILPIVGLYAVPNLNGGSTNNLVLEINMIDVETTSDIRLRDTLSVSILETTSGDEYILNTMSGSISVPLAADKHYFIYLSKTGSVTQSIEFHTAGSENSQSRTFFVDYEPEDVDDVNGAVEFPMSVVKFDNDLHSSVLVDLLGINIFHD